MNAIWIGGCNKLGQISKTRAAPSKVGLMPSFLTRPGFLQKVCQLSIKPTQFSGHHLDSQQGDHVTLGRGPGKPTKSNNVLAKLHTIQY